MRRSVVVAAAVAVGLASAATACSSSTGTPPASSSSTGAPAPTTTVLAQGSGPVQVLYAGSLSNLMTKQVGPAFHEATGYTLQGTSGDSGTLANEVKGKTVVGDVFISANPSKDQALEGSANGSWVDWYATFATSPLVVGYDPEGKFAAAFKSQPWYQAIDQPGLLLGRTDPTTDPKGGLTVKALETGATTYREPGLAADAKSSSEVFPEASLVGRLQSGQLDAGFFYSVEATAAHIPFIPVTGVGTLQATYTVTVLSDAPDRAAAEAFVGYLLGPAGQHLLKNAGIDLQTPPTVSGTPPSNLQAVLSGA